MNGSVIRADGNDRLSGMPEGAILSIIKVEYID